MPFSRASSSRSSASTFSGLSSAHARSVSEKWNRGWNSVYRKMSREPGTLTAQASHIQPFPREGPGKERALLTSSMA